VGSRKRVVLVASTTGYQTQMFSAAAGRANIHLILATDRCHILEDPWGDHAIAIRFDDPNRAAELLEQKAGHIDGIVAVGDRPALVAAVAAAKLGLRFHPPNAVAACRNKLTARERFRDSGMPTPEFYPIPVSADPPGARFYPCVLKPLGLSASRGVIRANNDSEFVAAFRRIKALLEHEEINHSIQVERFIPGREFALEGIVTGGRLDVAAMFDKPDPLDGPFFEETIYVTPSREPQSVQAAIVETTGQAIGALGLTDGPIHAEMRVNAQGVWILEVAARPIGGLCAKAIPGLEERILHHAVGEVPSPKPPSEAAGVMMIPIPREGVYNGVSGVEEAQTVRGITEVIVTAKQGHRIVPLPEGQSYLGFIFARAATPGEVEQSLRSAHAALEFEILAVLPVL
jgi:glutathione synthase/RimK-type ligase-like ATP-grasp enzyme